MVGRVFQCVLLAGHEKDDYMGVGIAFPMRPGDSKSVAQIVNPR